MRIKEHLTREQRKKMKSLSQRIKPPSKAKFSHKELEDMMGVHRDTFKRVKGAIRRK